jgi:hypothetical protein
MRLVRVKLITFASSRRRGIQSKIIEYGDSLSPHRLSLRLHRHELENLIAKRLDSNEARP